MKREMVKKWSEMKYLLAVICTFRNPIHPKLEKLQEIVQKHFDDQDECCDSKVIVFTQTRGSAQEIEGYLKFKCEKAKPKIFVGQNDNSDVRGLSQKEQIALVNDFRKGKLNTLVATCVAEEGLDIGEVDLIICYDSGLSPIRLVQRMGRTGRKRDGKVILLLSEKENSTYIMTENNRKELSRTIKQLFQSPEGEKHCFKENPRMIPEELTPQIEILQPVHQPNRNQGHFKADNQINPSMNGSKYNSTMNVSSRLKPIDGLANVEGDDDKEIEHYTGFDCGNLSDEDNEEDEIDWEELVKSLPPSNNNLLKQNEQKEKWLNPFSIPEKENQINFNQSQNGKEMKSAGAISGKMDGKFEISSTREGKLDEESAKQTTNQWRQMLNKDMVNEEVHLDVDWGSKMVDEGEAMISMKKIKTGIPEMENSISFWNGRQVNSESKC